MWNSYIFIKENLFENIVWEMASILSQPQWIKDSYMKHFVTKSPQ